MSALKVTIERHFIDSQRALAGVTIEADRPMNKRDLTVLDEITHQVAKELLKVYSSTSASSSVIVNNSSATSNAAGKTNTNAPEVTPTYLYRLSPAGSTARPTFCGPSVRRSSRIRAPVMRHYSNVSIPKKTPKKITKKKSAEKLPSTRK